MLLQQVVPYALSDTCKVNYHTCELRSPKKLAHDMQEITRQKQGKYSCADNITRAPSTWSRAGKGGSLTQADPGVVDLAERERHLGVSLLNFEERL